MIAVMYSMASLQGGIPPRPGRRHPRKQKIRKTPTKYAKLTVASATSRDIDWATPFTLGDTGYSECREENAMQKCLLVLC